MPDVLTLVSWLSLTSGIAAAVVIVVDLLQGHRQHMKIMNVVWPLTALWAGPLALFGYFRYGRAAEERAVRAAEEAGKKPPNMRLPFSVKVGKAATHCGSGCTLGDIVAELVVLAAPVTLFGQRMFGTWVVDMIAAFVLGIVFQYFTIVPMRHLGPKEGVVAAVKADTLSLVAWQLGMFGWMALARFVLFGHELSKARPEFWFMMQIAMLCGFVTAYPVNWWLLRHQLKEAM
jgi:hypothetical protein